MDGTRIDGGGPVVTVTGHRPHKLNNEWNHQGPLSDKIRQEIVKFLLDKKPSRCISGLALGTDTLFAQECLKLNIPLTAAVPFEGQEELWTSEAKACYYSILDNLLVTKVIVSPGPPSYKKYTVRDYWMVDQATEVFAVYDGCPKGGTALTVSYAKKKQKPLTIVDPTRLLSQ